MPTNQFISSVAHTSLFTHTNIVEEDEMDANLAHLIHSVSQVQKDDWKELALQDFLKEEKK